MPLLHTKAESVLAECNLSLSEKRSGVKVEWGEIEHPLVVHKCKTHFNLRFECRSLTSPAFLKL